MDDSRIKVSMHIYSLTASFSVTVLAELAERTNGQQGKFQSFPVL